MLIPRFARNACGLYMPETCINPLGRFGLCGGACCGGGEPCEYCSTGTTPLYIDAELPTISNGLMCPYCESDLSGQTFRLTQGESNYCGWGYAFTGNLAVCATQLSFWLNPPSAYLVFFGKFGGQITWRSSYGKRSCQFSNFALSYYATDSNTDQCDARGTTAYVTAVAA